MKKLIIMCGCPGSGKSTWIKEELKKSIYTVKVVSRDEIRFGLLAENDADYFAKEKAVFSLFCKEISDALANDYIDIVIADATHLNKRSRAKLLNNIKLPNKCIIEAVCLETPLDECLRRNAERTGLALVPEDALIQMYENYKRPSLYEGFHCIRVLQDNYKILISRRN